MARDKTKARAQIPNLRSVVLTHAPAPGTSAISISNTEATP
jgi:hypothetical protein